MKILGANFPDGETYIVSCLECGLVYCRTLANQQDFLTYYTSVAKSPKYYDMVGAEATRNYFQHILKLIEPYIHTESKILDIAGAWGELGEYMAKNGYPNVTILDPCEECILFAKQKGLLTVQTDSTEMGKVLQERYDLIIFNHTLEHILEIREAIENACKLLKDKGHIFIELPDAEEYANQSLPPFTYFTYEHVIHFTVHDIENLSKRYGLEIVGWNKYYKEVSRYPSFYVILKKNSEIKPITYSTVGKDSIKKYIAECNQQLHQMLEPYEANHEPLILWGIGASTALLLEAFSQCNVEQIVDSNPARQGLVFQIGNKKYPIVDPESIRSSRATIFILPGAYKNSIEKQIRDLGFENNITSFTMNQM
ncbi:class I SAM-dependent methyltransferase [Desulfitobacterium hafniense]|nr:class I SAM-dependent methyltransferase [Desulfitobacterium hafniense]